MDTENKIVYNSWPVGKLPKEFQRPELDQIKALGYDWKDPRDVVKMFEEKVAKFSGSKYAVAIDCCSHGLFLAIKALERKIKPIDRLKVRQQQHQISTEKSELEQIHLVYLTSFYFNLLFV